jgi:hypothetical protein
MWATTIGTVRGVQTWGTAVTTLTAMTTHNAGYAVLLCMLKLLATEELHRVWDISLHRSYLISDANMDQKCLDLRSQE